MGAIRRCVSVSESVLSVGGGRERFDEEDEADDWEEELLPEEYADHSESAAECEAAGIAHID